MQSGRKALSSPVLQVVMIMMMMMLRIMVIMMIMMTMLLMIMMIGSETVTTVGCSPAERPSALQFCRW